MKKIICLIQSLNPGGAERQIVGLSVLLKNLGYNVEVWTYYPYDFYLPILQSADVTYRYIPEAQNAFKRIFVLYKELKREKPNTVIAYLDTACIVACIIKAFGLKFKLIVSERNTTQKLTKKEKLKFWLYRFADFIVPNSHTQTEFIKTNFPVLVEKTECITNFVDTDKFIPIENKEETESIRILTVARIMPQKNVPNYIKAIKQVIDKGYNINVDWYGNPVDLTYYNESVMLLKEFNIEKIFQFHPATKNVIKEYQSSDIFCLPSIYEGFPNVICEAMCCGLPILCGNICDNPNIVENGNNGFLFNPHNINDIANSIEWLLKKGEKERKRMGQQSRELAIQKFSATSFINKYLELIEI